VITGFPNEHTFVDYEAGEIVQGRVEMIGNSGGNDVAKHLQEVAMQSPLQLNSYSGFCGAPVFALKSSGGMQCSSDLVWCCNSRIGIISDSAVYRASIFLKLLDAKLKLPR